MVFPAPLANITFPVIGSNRYKGVVDGRDNDSLQEQSADEESDRGYPVESNLYTRARNARTSTDDNEEN
jgi:hypothetical protein